MTYRHIIRGDLSVTREETLNAKFDTCCGIILYDGSGLRGLAHSQFSKVNLRLLSMSVMKADARFETSEQAAKLLLEEMIKEGATISDLRAGIFGCGKMGYGLPVESESFGSSNASEAEEILGRLRIQIIYNKARTPFNTDLFLDSKGISMQLLYPATNLPVYKGKFNFPYSMTST